MLKHKRDHLKLKTGVIAFACLFSAHASLYASSIAFIYAGDKRIATEEGGEKYFVVSDHLGSSVVHLDSSGNEVSHTEYKSFGGVKSETSTKTFHKKFTGKELDESTGLYDYEARQYDADIGRFITADTAEPKLENPQTLNRYSYTLNNPLKYIDPTGNTAVLAQLRFLLPGFGVAASFLAVPGFGEVALAGIGIVTAAAVLSDPEFRGTTFPASGPIGAAMYLANKASGLGPVDPAAPPGSARAAEPEVVKKDIVVRRFGKKNDPLVQKGGSVAPGAHSTTDRRIRKPETAKDKLDLPSLPEGFRDIRIRKEGILSKGKVPGGEFGGSGGKTEIINRTRLPKGSAGRFHKIGSRRR